MSRYASHVEHLRAPGEQPERPQLRLVRRGGAPPRPRLLGNGEEAFREILDRVDRARESIEIRAFVWRDDETGNMLASALLRAANRGVRVLIRKDRKGANYEYYAGTRQSFFHKQIDLTQRLQTYFLHQVYPAPRGSIRQRPNVLAEALLAHPNVEVDCQRKLHDHSKLYIFDDRSVVLGGMGIGDDHRKEWIDVMVALDSPELVRRLRARLASDEPFDAHRRIDFLVHSLDQPAARGCPLLAQRLALLDSARRSITVAMAYLGDARFGHALVRAARRGVQVTLVTSVKSDFLGALNRASCDKLLLAAGSERMRIAMLPGPMVHAKITVVDGLVADVGSANFTPLSHGTYNEIDLFVRDATFAHQLEEMVEGLAARGEQMLGRVRRSWFTEWVERAIVAGQSLHGF
jgi:cardiolipin synthase